MYRPERYEETDRMSDMICGNYRMLLLLSRFGIPLGFGDRSIGEVCRDNGVDVGTLLAVVNMLLDNDHDTDDKQGEVSLEAIVSYLEKSHSYFLDFRLPAIRSKLAEVTKKAATELSYAIMKFFDEYASEVRKHMNYENKNVFPYVRKLISGERDGAYNIAIFKKRHDHKIESKLSELKNIIIKYYPAGSSNELNSVLFDIFTCEEDLASHNAIEDKLFVPAVTALERNRKPVR